MDRTEHLLICLAEECSEVSQRVSKALRFGLQEIQPGQDLTNAQRIVGELVDLLAVVDMLENESVFELPHDQGALLRKQEKVRKFMDCAQQCGTLTA